MREKLKDLDLGGNCTWQLSERLQIEVIGNSGSGQEDCSCGLKPKMTRWYTSMLDM